MLFRMLLVEAGSLDTGVSAEGHNFSKACPSFHHTGECGFA